MRVFILLDGYQKDTATTTVLSTYGYTHGQVRAVLEKAGKGRLFNGKVFFEKGTPEDIIILGPQAVHVAQRVEEGLKSLFFS